MIGRFAPSPTGPLHLGSLRTALAAWLAARTGGSDFLVRIEDLDPQRSRRVWEDGQLSDLAALGIDRDGPLVRQSARDGHYAEALDRLRRAGRVYPCFCTRAEIRAAAGAPHDDLAEGAYPGTCRRLSEAEGVRRIAAGHPHALRIDAGAPRIAFSDRIQDEAGAVVDDFVVRRTDGVAAYQLAVVVDDAAQGIEEVVRGADLLTSTPRQILLQRRLGLPTPAYAHIGLVLGPDGARLAKRHGATALADRAALGESRERTLALLAHSLGLARGQTEVGSAAELLPGFDLSRLPAPPIRID